MYDDVLVPTDGSEGTDDTLRHALDLAQRHDATVHALSVVDRRLYLAAADENQDDLLETLEAEAEAAAAAVEGRARDVDLDVVAVVREGIPYRAILEYVDEEGADVVAMGTHGRTGRDRLAHLGSVTERVIKNTDVPVLVVSIGSGD